MHNLSESTIEHQCLKVSHHCVIVVLASTTICECSYSSTCSVCNVTDNLQLHLHLSPGLSLGPRIHFSFVCFSSMDSKHEQPQLPQLKHITCWKIRKWQDLFEVEAYTSVSYFSLATSEALSTFYTSLQPSVCGGVFQSVTVSSWLCLFNFDLSIKQRTFATYI